MDPPVIIILTTNNEKPEDERLFRLLALKWADHGFDQFPNDFLM